jgi:hypothetical protein
MSLLCAVLAFRIWPEAGNQVEGVAAKDLLDDGGRRRSAPGAAFDQQAGGAICDLQRAGDGQFGGDGGNAVFCLGPRYVLYQPGAGRGGAVRKSTRSASGTVPRKICRSSSITGTVSME